MEFCLYVEVFRPLLGVIRQRRLQAQFIQCDRTQFPGKKIDIGIELVDNLLQVINDTRLALAFRVF